MNAYEAAAATILIIIIIIIAFVSQLAFRFRVTFGVFIILCCRCRYMYGRRFVRRSHNGMKRVLCFIKISVQKSRRPMCRWDDDVEEALVKTTLAVFTCRITQCQTISKGSSSLPTLHMPKIMAQKIHWMHTEWMKGRRSGDEVVLLLALVFGIYLENAWYGRALAFQSD